MPRVLIYFHLNIKNTFSLDYIGRNRKKAYEIKKNNDKEIKPIILLDEKRKAAMKWKITTVPHLIIVNKSGIVNYEGLLLKKKQIINEIKKVLL
ncbi:MAG: hypothetical protein JJV92_06285 [Desulfosarcina sp.]|nr:hypothetical protein [Desulfobacterales bacterium]